MESSYSSVYLMVVREGLVEQEESYEIGHTIIVDSRVWY